MRSCGISWLGTGRIVALLVERVDSGTECLNVRLRVDGLSGLMREIVAGSEEAAA